MAPGGHVDVKLEVGKGWRALLAECALTHCASTHCFHTASFVELYGSILRPRATTIPRVKTNKTTKPIMTENAANTQVRNKH